MSPRFDDVVSFHALCSAARRAARGKRLSRQTCAFLMDLEPEVLGLQRELLERTYRPRPFHTFHITDPKPRTISAAHFRDRVVHHALCAAIEPTLEAYAIADSYACRRGKGTVAALDRAQALSRRFDYFLKLDIQRHFETVDHAVLLGQLDGLLRDPGIRWLSKVFVSAGAPGSATGTGLPIGNLTSQHFANLYLGALDHFITGSLGVAGYVRYMDDLLLFADNPAALRGWARDIERYCRDSLRLQLRHDATRRGPVRVGVPFLGLRIWPRLRRLDGARVRRLRRRFRALNRVWRAGDVPHSHSVASACSLIGWATLADTVSLRRSILAAMDPDSG